MDNRLESPTIGGDGSKGAPLSDSLGLCSDLMMTPSSDGGGSPPGATEKGSREANGTGTDKEAGALLLLSATSDDLMSLSGDMDSLIFREALALADQFANAKEEEEESAAMAASWQRLSADAGHMAHMLASGAEAAPDPEPEPAVLEVPCYRMSEPPPTAAAPRRHRLVERPASERERAVRAVSPAYAALCEKASAELRQLEMQTQEEYENLQFAALERSMSAAEDAPRRTPLLTPWDAARPDTGTYRVSKNRTGTYRVPRPAAARSEEPLTPEQGSERPTQALAARVQTPGRRHHKVSGSDIGHTYDAEAPLDRTFDTAASLDQTFDAETTLDRTFERRRATLNCTYDVDGPLNSTFDVPPSEEALDETLETSGGRGWLGGGRPLAEQTLQLVDSSPAPRRSSAGSRRQSRAARTPAAALNETFESVAPPECPAAPGRRVVNLNSTFEYQPTSTVPPSGAGDEPPRRRTMGMAPVQLNRTMDRKTLLNHTAEQERLLNLTVDMGISPSCPADQGAPPGRAGGSETFLNRTLDKQSLLNRTAVQEELLNRTADRSAGLNRTKNGDVSLNGTIDRPDAALNRTMDRPNAGLNRTMDRPDAALNRTMDRPDAALNRTMDRPDAALNRTMDRPDAALNRTMDRPDTALNRTMDRPDAALNRTMDRPAKHTMESAVEPDERYPVSSSPHPQLPNGYPAETEPLSEPPGRGASPADQPAGEFRAPSVRSPEPAAPRTAPRQPTGPVTSTPHRSVGSASSAGLTPISAGRPRTPPEEAHRDTPPPYAAIRAPAAGRNGLVRMTVQQAAGMLPRANGLVRHTAGLRRPATTSRASSQEQESEPEPELEPEPEPEPTPAPAPVHVKPRQSGLVRPSGLAAPRAASGLPGPRTVATSGLAAPRAVTPSGLAAPRASAAPSGLAAPRATTPPSGLAAPRATTPTSGLSAPRAAASSGLAAPRAAAPSGLAAPRATGVPAALRPPAARGLRAPAASGLRPPGASGLRAPAASGLRRPATAQKSQAAPAAAVEEPSRSARTSPAPQTETTRAPSAAAAAAPRPSGLPMARGSRLPAPASRLPGPGGGAARGLKAPGAVRRY